MIISRGIVTTLMIWVFAIPILATEHWVESDDELSDLFAGGLVIAGVRKIGQLTDSLEAGAWDLPDDAYEELKGLLPQYHGYPHEWMETALVPAFSLTEDPPGRAQLFPPVVG